MLSEALRTHVVIADLDLAFGTAGLDFNQDPVRGIADAVASPQHLDDMLLDRLLTKCSEHLSILAAPVMLDHDYDLTAEACGTVVDAVRRSVPYVAVDLPHTWSAWMRHLLHQADEVVVTAVPDLANLRNSKYLVDFLKQSRSNDDPPRLVLNMVNTPERPEIGVEEFCRSLDLHAVTVIEFDGATFGRAANDGRMIQELNGKAQAVAPLRELAFRLAQRQPAPAAARKSTLAPLLDKLEIKL